MKKLIAVLLTSILISTTGIAEVKTENIEYKENGVTLKGFLAWDDSLKGKRPGVLVVHEWWGLNDYTRSRAKELASLGYVAFALDMYGAGENTEHPDKASGMMEHLQKNEPLLLSRAKAGLAVLKNNALVDSSSIAGIGYCFGGYVILKMIYSGEDLKAGVTFHGSLPVPEDTSKIKSRILILHGEKDSFIPDKNINGVKEAFNKAKVNYEFISYPDAVHGFTVPGAEKRGIKGIAYNENADKQSWAKMQQLFKEVFSKK